MLIVPVLSSSLAAGCSIGGYDQVCAEGRECGVRKWRIGAGSSCCVRREGESCGNEVAFGWNAPLQSLSSSRRNAAATRKSFVVHATAQDYSEGRGAGDGGGDAHRRSYLSMWKNAKDRYEKEQLQQHSTITKNNPEAQEEDHGVDKEIQVQREKQFARILQVPQEERDRAHRLQVIDRAAAALAAAEALLASKTSTNERKWEDAASRGWGLKKLGDSSRRSVVVSAEPTTTVVQFPGPDFWTWSPPPPSQFDQTHPPKAPSSQPEPSNPGGAVLEKDREAAETLDIPFETEAASSSSSDDAKRSVLPLVFQSRAAPSVPPLQSLVEVKEVKLPVTKPVTEIPAAVPERDKLADSVVHQDLQNNKAKFSTGVNPDGSRWWKETGEEDRGNGIVCSWTVTRGVSSEGVVEWEEKFWEACDDFDYKELGSEKSGRDASGNVWREFWKEAIWQDAKSGLLHMEKSAEKWGKNGCGGQWNEKWCEHYDASGRAEKWADKWSVIDPNTPLDPGHGHVWHERWGEEFDGQGGAMKYTDKWAERAEFGGWTKWGDKWDERFDGRAVGRKQGETWWAGAGGERWNKTWGEGHDGSGWVHKYGESSSGERWDTHEEQETWYERHPHYGFHHCMDNSQQLQKVSKKKKRRL